MKTTNLSPHSWRRLWVTSIIVAYFFALIVGGASCVSAKRTGCRSTWGYGGYR
jgi:hypothetical protein